MVVVVSDDHNSTYVMIIASLTMCYWHTQVRLRLTCVAILLVGLEERKNNIIINNTNITALLPLFSKCD